jgi:predicted phosphohydrolase
MSTISMLHNNAYPFGDFVICGSRGWISPDDPDFTGEDQKVFTREVEKAEVSLNEGVRLGGEIIAMLHYPPLTSGTTQCLC